MDVGRGNITFFSIITPITNLRGRQSKSDGEVEFTFRRMNGTLTLQWEPFEGYIVPTGTKYLEVRQTISGKPLFRTVYPVWMNYEGKNVVGSVHVDPSGAIGSDISFELPHPTQGANERVEVYGSCVTWHAAPGC